MLRWPTTQHVLLCVSEATLPERLGCTESCHWTVEHRATSLCNVGLPFCEIRRMPKPMRTHRGHAYRPWAIGRSRGMRLRRVTSPSGPASTMLRPAIVGAPTLAQSHRRGPPARDGRMRATHWARLLMEGSLGLHRSHPMVASTCSRARPKSLASPCVAPSPTSLECRAAHCHDAAAQKGSRPGCRLADAGVGEEVEEQRLRRARKK